MGVLAGILYVAPVLFAVLLLLVLGGVAWLCRRLLKCSPIASATAGLAFAAALGGATYWSLVTSLPGARDHEDASKVVQAIKAEFPFKPGDAAGGPTIKMRPHPKRTEVNVFGVVDPADQERIVEAAKRAHALAPHKPVILAFLPEAKFEGHPSGLRKKIQQDPLRVESIGR